MVIASKEQIHAAEGISTWRVAVVGDGRDDSGYAKATWSYDERDNPTGETFFDLDGRPI